MVQIKVNGNLVVLTESKKLEIEEIKTPNECRIFLYSKQSEFYAETCMFLPSKIWITTF